MLIKIFLAAALSLSVSCFAEPGGDKSKSSSDSNQQTQSSQSGSSTSDPSTTKESSQPTQDSKTDKKPPMVDYCQKNTC
ncbi:hypothetical protein Nit79A3_2123 [Nitrosomonas sp. Is79A3]|uniref:hypothetical protein n=1 Tax=Nitrosomonas sp. (strain Is79A3) TaxID=261292 RepID=UPI000215D1EE